ncbi:hypothetical protein [Modestobacter sp. SYSU DS0290]
MSSPRDRDAFDEGGPEGWREPAHLGRESDGDQPADTPGSSAEPPRPDDRTDDDRTDDGPAGWQPPGWDLPAVEPERPRAQPPAPPQAPTPYPGAQQDQPWQPPAADPRETGAPAPEERRGGGLFGGRPRRERRPGAYEQAFAPQGDPWGTQAWAAAVGWTASDGTGPEDAALAQLVASAPVRPGKEDRPGNVVRGRGNGLDLVACDVLSPLGRDRWASTHAITAAPVLGAVPAFRLTPARFWRHGTGGLLHIPSPDAEFDRRWVLLAAEDGPQLRRLVEDPLVRQLLLGSDDGDELWSAAGYVAAIRPDGQRPQLIEHHARLLAAVVGALAAAA